MWNEVIIDGAQPIHMCTDDPVDTDEIPHSRGMIRLIVRHENAVIFGMFTPERVAQMIADWAETVAEHGGDNHRRWTRHAILEYVTAEPKPGDPKGHIVLSAAAWMQVTGEKAEELKPAFERGDLQASYTVIINPDRTTNFRMENLIMDPESIS